MFACGWWMVDLQQRRKKNARKKVGWSSLLPFLVFLFVACWEECCKIVSIKWKACRLIIQKVRIREMEKTEVGPSKKEDSVCVMIQNETQTSLIMPSN